MAILLATFSYAPYDGNPYVTEDGLSAYRWRVLDSNSIPSTYIQVTAKINADYIVCSQDPSFTQGGPTYYIGDENYQQSHILSYSPTTFQQDGTTYYQLPGDPFGSFNYYPTANNPSWTWQAYINSEYILPPLYFAFANLDATTGSLAVVPGSTQRFGGAMFGQDYNAGLYKQGTAANDALYTFLGDDYIDGIDGNDTIQSGEGDDDIYGSNGRDNVFGQGGNDYLDGGEGSDIIVGGSGNDDIYAGGGSDKIYGGVNDDFLVGGTGSDTIDGGEGNDTIIGGDGRDSLVGGAGDDVYVLDDPFDIITDAQGSDTVIICYQVSSFTLKGGVENADISNNSSVTSLTGTISNNELTGNNIGDLLSGQGGQDTLVGGSGNDTLNGGSGNDTFNDSSSDQAITANLTTGTASGASIGTDTLISIETVLSGTGDDLLIGNSIGNAFTSNDGDDLINGGGGTDTMSGGEGNDLYIISNSTEHVATEVFDAGSMGSDELRFSATTAGQTLTIFAGDTGLERVVIGTGSAIGEAVTTATTALNVNASNGANALSITGNNGSNTISGSTFDDMILGNGGNDSLIGAAGNDSLSGGLGADVFRFSSPLDASTNVDLISDFVIAESDRLQLENTGTGLFTAITTIGTLATSAFVAGAAFSTSSQRILYETSSGNLFYDADGFGPTTSPVLFAHLAAGLAMTASQFLVT